MLEGSIVALITPFTESLNVNFKKLEEMVETQYMSKTDALLLLGSTSESTTLNEYEKDQIISCVVNKNDRRMKIVIAVISNSLNEVILKGKKYIELGADYLLLIPPYYIKSNQTGIIKYFREISTQLNIPIIIYNIPSRVGFNLEIETIKEDLDSVGGIIETVISLPSSIGEPFFDSLESRISQYLFSVPGLKGIEFGLGFDFAKYRGKEVNDELVNDGEVRTLTNNNGGINGGISNSMPIVFRCVLKPTPSILKEQRSIDENFNNTILEIKGRHDPCIVRRARVVIDSLVALCLLDLISINEGKKWMC